MKEGHPVHRRHAQIGNGDIDTALAHYVKGGISITRSLNGIAVRLQQAL